MGFLERTFPQVERRWLRWAAGVLWSAAGVMLLVRAAGWLVAEEPSRAVVFLLVGTVAAVVIGRFKFGHIAERNRRRIEQLQEPVGLWAFQSIRSYLLVVGMMAFGIALRHSTVPKHYLAVLYVGIGGGLILASLTYFHD